MLMQESEVRDQRKLRVIQAIDESIEKIRNATERMIAELLTARERVINLPE